MIISIYLSRLMLPSAGKRFSIVDSGHDELETTIKEALHIKYKKPKLNRQLYSQGASIVLGVFYWLCLDFWMNWYFTSLYCHCIEIVVYCKCSIDLDYLYTGNLSFMNFSWRRQHESAEIYRYYHYSLKCLTTYKRLCYLEYYSF